MDFITIRDTKIPALGYGTWKLSGADCVKGVEMALANGYRHIDTAQIYENETEVGAAIVNSGVGRENIFLTTKVWTENVRAGDLQSSVQESLRKLRVDSVDLLLIHWPVEDKASFREQLAALVDVQKRGQTKMIGVSNFTVAQMQHVVEEIGAPIVTNQVEYHPYLSQQPVLQYLKAKGMFLTAYSPIARGKVMEDKIIARIAETHGKKPGQVALRWLLQQGMVAAIPKAASEKHMQDNIAIFDFSLTHAEMNEITALARADGRMINPDWAPQWDVAA
ncbi:MAG: aldo/keto reductase [Alphaproteobacteria bacterium]|nr:aldo/keto reductase [Alphaproteobacteria bacterium]